MRKHITRGELEAEGTGAEIAAAARAEQKFSEITNCTRCRKPLAPGVVWRRLYQLPGVRAHVVLCDGCNSAVPTGSASDLAFQADIKRLALASAPPGGRA